MTTTTIDPKATGYEDAETAVREGADALGLPWCAAYSAAYRERARELAAGEEV